MTRHEYDQLYTAYRQMLKSLAIMRHMLFFARCQFATEDKVNTALETNTKGADNDHKQRSIR